MSQTCRMSHVETFPWYPEAQGQRSKVLSLADGRSEGLLVELALELGRTARLATALE